MEYTEILKLKAMLEKANIPFEFTDDLFGAMKNDTLYPPLPNSYPAYQIRIGIFVMLSSIGTLMVMGKICLK